MITRQNKKYIVTVIATIFLAALLLALTAEPKGYCSGKAFNGKTGVYLTDEEFIFATLKTSAGVFEESGTRTFNPSDEVIKNYMSLHPECCRVYRNEDEFSSNGWIRVRSGLLSRFIRSEQTFVVEHRDLLQVLQRSGVGESQAMVNVCGHVYLD